MRRRSGTLGSSQPSQFILAIVAGILHNQTKSVQKVLSPLLKLVIRYTNVQSKEYKQLTDMPATDQSLFPHRI